jgi:maleate isomerase
VKHLGLVVVSSDLTMETEFHEFLPYGVNMYVSRMPLREFSPAGLARMEEESTAAVDAIKDVRPDLIVYGCTSGSILEGKGYDARIEQKITAATGIPSLTTAHAVVEYLEALGVNDVEIATPYTKDIDDLEERFFTEHGFRVTQLNGMGISEDHILGTLDPQEISEFVMSHHDPAGAEAVFISCTDLRVMSVLPFLRRRLNRPVFSSNLATLWAVCQRLHLGRDNPLFDDYENA